MHQFIPMKTRAQHSQQLVFEPQQTEPKAKGPAFTPKTPGSRARKKRKYEARKEEKEIIGEAASLACLRVCASALTRFDCSMALQRRRGGSTLGATSSS